jgi:putative hydrolases of HD superfamily
MELMRNNSLVSQLEFLREIDRLKSVVRQSPLLDQSRKENSAEHSWHLAMYAMILAGYAIEPIEISRVIQMLLIHDIIEVDAGDTPIHSVTDGSQTERERNASIRIFGILQGEQGENLRILWEEFEAGKTNDARFAKAIDRFQPLLANVFTNGGTWAENQVSQDQVFNRYGPVIKLGSPELWNLSEEWILQYFGQVE